MGFCTEKPARIVSPYRVETALKRAHREFDWIGAFNMMRDSAVRFGHEVIMISNDEKPVPHLVFPSKEKFLMLWILKVSIQYLESEHFTEDTIFLCPDTLVTRPLYPPIGWGKFDIGLCFRFDEKFTERPLLNSLQFWPVKSKRKLIQFYKRAYALAEKMPRDIKKWGGDSKPIEELCSPLNEGVWRRAGMHVLQINSDTIISAPIKKDRMHWNNATVIDFRTMERKQWMSEFYEKIMRESI